MVNVGDTVGNAEGLAKACPVPHSMLGEDCPKSAENGSAKSSLAGPEALCLPQHWCGQAAPWAWGDQVSTGTEQQAFLSALQDPGDLPASLGELGLLCWPTEMARTPAGEGPPRFCSGPSRLSCRGWSGNR